MTTYFDWPNSPDRFARFDTVRSADANDALDQVTAGFTAVAVDTNRAIKIPASPTPSDQLINLTAMNRAGLVMAFDSNGNATAISGGFRWRGDWLTATDYVQNDVFQDPSNDNIYIVLQAYTSSASIATDVSNGNAELAIDVATVSAASSAAVSAASAAATSAGNAATSATNASNSASTAVTQAGLAVAAYDSFDDRYLGPKAADPTLDNDGNALLTGALYFNTVANRMKVYTGAAWDLAYVPTSGFMQVLPVTITSGPTACTANNHYYLGGAHPLTFSATPASGDEIEVSVPPGVVGATINPNGQNFQNTSGTMNLDIVPWHYRFKFNTTKGWI